MKLTSVNKIIDFDTLLAILGRETLNCKETFVFNAADNWARAECHRYVRTFFGNYVQIIISHKNSVKITLQRLDRILLLNDFFFMKFIDKILMRMILSNEDQFLVMA